MAAAGAALVLGSGGARGAYEVGVARFLFEDLHAQLGRVPDVGVLCGTSAGALNALALASFADDRLAGVGFLWRKWSELRLATVVRPDRVELLHLTRTALGCPPPRWRLFTGGGGILDAGPFRAHVSKGLPHARIERHLRAGHLDAVVLTATEVETGRTVHFVRRRDGGGAGFPPNRAVVTLHDAQLGPEHALASAAIPLLFPPVEIGGRLYCDGSLRQSVPLSPALHLGATRVVAVSTQHCPPRVAPFVERERERAAASPAYLLGKAIDALTLDSIDDDIERLTLTNQIIAAGERAFGAAFLAGVNRELSAATGRNVQPVHVVLVRPSESLGRLAAEYVRSRAFKASIGGLVARTFDRLADGEAEHEADLLSYLLFDGPFAVELMQLGYTDARAQAEEIRCLFELREAASTARKVG